MNEQIPLTKEEIYAARLQRIERRKKMQPTIKEFLLNRDPQRRGWDQYKDPVKEFFIVIAYCFASCLLIRII